MWRFLVNGLYCKILIAMISIYDYFPRVMILFPWLTLEFKAWPGCKLTTQPSLPHWYRDTLSIVHLFGLELGFGHGLMCLEICLKPHFSCLVRCGKEELSTALFVVEMYMLFWSLCVAGKSRRDLLCLLWNVWVVGDFLWLKRAEELCLAYWVTMA